MEVDACMSSLLKEELAWTADRQFWVISNLVICMIKTVIVPRNYVCKRNKAILNLKQHCLRCYAALSSVL